MKRQADQTIEVTIEAPCGINSQTGKSEEIEILSRITNRFGGTQTYLSSLFSAALLEYFAGTVKDDFCPDIMADYRSEMAKRVKAEMDATSLRSQLESRDADYNRIKDLARDELSGKNNMIDRLTESVSNLQNRYSEQVGATNKAERERDQLAETVRDLKVKLFDLMNNIAA